MAGFEVTTNGRIWVTTEDSDIGMPCGKRGLIRRKLHSLLVHLQWAKER